MPSIQHLVSRAARTKFVRDTAMLQMGTLVGMGTTLLTSMVVARGLAPEGYGFYRLAVALFGMLTTLNLTGLNLSTTVRLSAALARADSEATLDLMAFYVKLSAWVAAGGLALAFALGPPVARALYGEPTVGDLARWLALLLTLDSAYQLLGVVLQSGRRMARLTAMSSLSALVNLGLIGAAVVGGHGAWGVVGARLIASALMSALAVGYYALLRASLDPDLPPLRAIVKRALSVPVRRHAGFGVGIALDKNVAGLFALLPVQLLGSLHGAASAGYLGLAQSAIGIPSSAFNAAMRNLGVRLPQDVGRGDYAALRRNYSRVTAVLAAGGVIVYGLFALVAPWLVTWLYGDEYRPASPLIAVLAICGAVSAMGGSMGALYRALERVRWALAAKLATLALLALPGYWLIREHGALGAAWTLTGLIALSVALTALVVLPYLNRLARDIREDS